MPLDSDRYDLFISYAKKDNETGWIQAFVARAIKQTEGSPDLTYFFDQVDIHAGDDWSNRLHGALQRSRVFIAFLSPNYFISEWCLREWEAWTEIEVSKHVLSNGALPVLIAPIFDGKQSIESLADEISLLPPVSSVTRMRMTRAIEELSGRQMFDCVSAFDKNPENFEDARISVVLNQFRDALGHLVERIRNAGQSPNRVPPYNKKFCGRRKELNAIRQKLQDSRSGVVHGINSLGGLGKTELAFTYAHGFASEYPGGRFLVNCEGHSSLQDAIVTLQKFVEFTFTDEDRSSGKPFEAISRVLASRLDKVGSILLILDNVTDRAL